MEATTARSQVKHSPNGGFDTSSFTPVGSMENLGAIVLHGRPEGWVRLDLDENGVRAGVFIASAGRLTYTFPSTEHATILEGEVTLTDQDGVSETYRTGDSWVIGQGTVMTGECSGRVVKSFLNVVDD